MTTTTDKKAEALAAYFCEENADGVTLCKWDHYGLPVYDCNGEEYAIGTDEEVQEACKACVRDSVWAFRASFILQSCGLPQELEEVIAAFQEKKCEDANDALLALVEKCCEDGLEEFTEDAIRADGRGHFLASYDGEELEIPEEGAQVPYGTMYFAYRIN